MSECAHDNRSLAEPFARALPAERRSEFRAWEGAEEYLRELVTAAHAKWPGVMVPDEVFASYLAARVDSKSPVQEALRRACATDLYLACACVCGEPVALQTLDTECFPVVAAALRKCRLQTSDIDDALQELRTLVLVGSHDATGTLAVYAGRGSLKGWLKVIGLRLAQRLHPKEQRGGTPSDSQFPEADQLSLSPEVLYLKKTYAKEVKAAVEEGLVALDVRDRVMLRQLCVDGLNYERLACLYGLNPTTAARRIERARMSVIRHVRRSLRTRLGLSHSQLEGILATLGSDLNVSLHGLTESDIIS